MELRSLGYIGVRSAVRTIGTASPPSSSGCRGWTAVPAGRAASRRTKQLEAEHGRGRLWRTRARGGGRCREPPAAPKPGGRGAHRRAQPASDARVSTGTASDASRRRRRSPSRHTPAKTRALPAALPGPGQRRVPRAVMPLHPSTATPPPPVRAAAGLSRSHMALHERHHLAGRVDSAGRDSTPQVRRRPARQAGVETAVPNRGLQCEVAEHAGLGTRRVRRGMRQRPKHGAGLGPRRKAMRAIGSASASSLAPRRWRRPAPGGGELGVCQDGGRGGGQSASPSLRKGENSASVAICEASPAARAQEVGHRAPEPACSIQCAE